MSGNPSRPHNPRSLRNFPMQANGAEMLRLACCLGIERGVEICAPVHDAVLIKAPLDRLDHDIAVMREAMAEASRAVLGGARAAHGGGRGAIPRPLYGRGSWPGNVGSFSGIDRPPPNTGGIAMEPTTIRPENLQLSPAQQTAKSVVVSANVKKRREQFALVPMSLWETLNDAPEQTLRLLVYLIHMYWQGEYEPVDLANGMMSINGVAATVQAAVAAGP